MRTEVVLAERGAVGQLEVVVEAVLDRRADGVGGAGEQRQHRLRQHVRRRMADARTGPRSLSGVTISTPGAIGQRRRQIALGTVDDRDKRVFGQTFADRRREVARSRPSGQLTDGVVGQSYLDRCCRLQRHRAARLPRKSHEPA